MGKGKTSSRLARAKPEWGIQVLLKDGRRSWYFRDDRYRDDSGRPAERWSPYEGQAVRFKDERVAQRVAAAMTVNASAVKYEVVPLTPRAAVQRGRSKPLEGHADGVGQGA
jgi:hypothetical protein